MFSSDISEGLTLCVISELSASKSGPSRSSGSPRWAQTRHMARAILSDRRARSYRPAVQQFLGGLRRGGGDLRLLEHDLAVPGLGPHGVALTERTVEDRDRQRVDQALLDDALERARAVGRVVAEVAQQRAGVVGQLDLDAALLHAGDQAL